MKKFFVLVACGNPAAKQLDKCLDFLRKFSRTPIIAVVSNIYPLKNKPDLLIEVKQDKKHEALYQSRFLKTSLYKILDNINGNFCYLDNDIYIVNSSMDEIFSYKNGPITFSSDHYATIRSFSKDAIYQGYLPDELYKKFKVQVEENWNLWNGGVFLFDKHSKFFLDTWHKYTLQVFKDKNWISRDQAALIATVWQHKLENNYRLPKEFNWLSLHSGGYGKTLDFDGTIFSYQKRIIKSIHFIQYQGKKYLGNKDARQALRLLNN